MLWALQKPGKLCPTQMWVRLFALPPDASWHPLDAPQPMPCHRPPMTPTMLPSNATSPVSDGPNDATSLSRVTSRMVGIGDGSSCEEGRMCKWTTRQCASHTPSCFFFHWQGSVHLVCCPVFVSSFPPAGSPSPDIDEAACGKHAILFSLFFCWWGGVHLAHRLVFFLSFCPEALLLGDLRGSVHSTHCLFIFLFFIDGGGTRPHSGSFPPLLGGFFFFCGCIINRGGVWPAHPASFISPHLLGVFFLQLHYWRGGDVQPTCRSLLSRLPLRNGGIFFCFAIVKHTGAVYYAHAAPHLSYPLLCTLCSKCIKWTVKICNNIYYISFWKGESPYKSLNTVFTFRIFS